jgi:hypothetical protein
MKASSSLTGFTVRHTAGLLGVGVRDAADRVVHRQRRQRTGVCHVLPLWAVWRGSRARAHKRIGQCRRQIPMTIRFVTVRSERVADFLRDAIFQILVERFRAMGAPKASPRLATQPFDWVRPCTSSAPSASNRRALARRLPCRFPIR